MRTILLLAALMSTASMAHSQKKIVKQINRITTSSVALEPLHFLASDSLKGRSPKRPEIHVAENYIANYLRDAGATPIHEAPDYFQSFELQLPTKDTTQPGEVIQAKNIIGLVPGTDDSLSNQ